MRRVRRRSQSGQALVAALIATVVVFALAGALVTAASASLSQQRGSISPLTQDLATLSGVNAAAAAIAASPGQCPVGALGSGGELGAPACGRVPYVLPLSAGAALLGPAAAGCASTRLVAGGHISAWVNSPAGASLYVDGSSTGCAGGSSACSAVRWPAPQSPLMLIRDCDLSGLSAVYAHLSGDSQSSVVRYSTAEAFVGDPASPLAISGQVTAIATGRFHSANDGRVDLAVATAGPTEAILVFRGMGDGSFQQCASIPADSPSALLATDLDGNSLSDLIFTNPDPDDNSVSVYLATGDCTFRAPTESPIRVGQGPSSVAAFNLRSSSSDLSLAVTNRTDGTVSIIDGEDGELSSVTTYSVGGPGVAPSAIVAGQFTGSQFSDLMVADAGSGKVALLTNSSNGTFAAATYYSVGGAPAALATADFDGDGALDLAVANGSSTLTVLLAAGRSSSPVRKTTQLPGPAAALAVGSFDGGALPDLVALLGSPGNAALPLLGNGDGTFRPAVGGAIAGAGGGAAAVAAGPITGDSAYNGIVFGGSGWLSFAVHNPLLLYSLVAARGGGPSSTEVDIVTGTPERLDLRYEGTLG